jgi:hypothetical protein
MLRRLYAILPAALLAMAAVATAAPPEVPAEVVAKAGSVTEVVVKVPKGTEIGYRLTGGKAAFRELKGDFENERVFWLVPEADGPLSVVWWTKGETASSLTEINKGKVPVPPVPPPVPPGPNPPPVPPAPDPLKSFRVILIYESGDTLPVDQRAIIYGRVVEDYLNANCTGGKAGWRRRDKDAPGEADPTMSALWDSIKPAITVTPCVAMERNGKVEIVNLEASPAKMVEKLQAYRGK